MPYQISFSPTGRCARRIQNNALAQVNEGPGQRVAGSFVHLDSFILLCYYFRKSGAFTSLSDAVFGESGTVMVSPDRFQCQECKPPSTQTI